MLSSVAATRYVTALREGGSLPGLMEADDLGTYVVKFTGAGQGSAALVAEVIVGSLAASIGLPTPRLVLVEVDPVLAANEPDEEVQHLLRASAGRNLGVDFLPGALDFDGAAFEVDPGFAGQVLWFDALVGNVDRSWRNPNMLFWHGTPYLIDHGAALTFHHNWASVERAAVGSYDASEHVLLACAPDLDAADDLDVSEARVAAALALVPGEWLEPRGEAAGAEDLRARYAAYFAARIASRATWESALRAAIATGPKRTIAHARRPDWLR